MTTAAVPTLHHFYSNMPARPIAFADTWDGRSLAGILDIAAASHIRTVYLVAGPYASERPHRDYWVAPVSEGWQMSGYIKDPTQATYYRDPHRVDVKTSAPWFGHARDKVQLQQAWRTLGNLLRGSWGQAAHAFGTPARTGLDLILRTLPAVGEYPILPDDLRTIIGANIGQGRQEFVPTTETTAPSLTWLDGRWMYAACVSHLPCGQVRYDHSHAYIEHLPAYYFVRFRAPEGWPFPFGLLPALSGQEDGPRFVYPHDRAWHTGWITGAEYEVARAEGWDVHISERITWDMSQPDPLRRWAEKLRTIRTYTPDELVAYALRHILIDAVGSLGRRARRELRAVHVSQTAQMPPDAYGEWEEGGRINYFVDVPLSRELLPFQHPEWCGMVWGRSRARLMKAALRYLRTTPGGEIAAFRSDAFVATRDPGWPDDGKVGTFRAKRRLENTAVPPCEEAYRALLHLAAEDEEEQ